MKRATLPIRNVSARYWRALNVSISLPCSPRHVSSSSHWRGRDTSQLQERHQGQDGGNLQSTASEKSNEYNDESGNDDGAMTRLLRQMSEENLEQTGSGGPNAVEESGFSGQLKDELLDRIATSNSGSSSMRNQYPSAFAEAEMPPAAGRGTRDIAGATPWIGDESVPDAALRMLNDSYKPLRRPSKVPSLQKPPPRVDTGRPRKEKRGGSTSSGTRLANARDRSSMYSYLQDSSLSDKEKEEMRKELKNKFKAGARPMPTTLQGLSSLANERIEDAISRGQFKSLPRGKQIERDHNMSSPFLDTTEYFMNKIIQKQEIVPPWIEKQQEVANDTARFRGRLRAEWRRHAARVIASQGGSLDVQMKRAEEYATAEMKCNPLAKPKQKDQPIAAANEARLSQISPSGELKVPQPPSNDNDRVKVVDTLESTIEPTTERAMTASTPASDSQAVHEERRLQDLQDLQELQELLSSQSEDSTSADEEREQKPPRSPQDTTMPAASHPFRDSTWVTHEHSYHTTAVNSLNALIRSYNLMAPDLAKKPYLNLDRELNACYADVAPSLASEIRERALAPKARLDGIAESERTGSGGGIFGSARGGTKVWDEKRERRYGFKEFMRAVAGSLWREGDEKKGKKTD